nr:uncharacterized protein LOC109184816 [Ipomoea batatas]
MASSSTSGQSYTFSLKLRYGGRITLCNPPKYLGGKVTTFSDMDSDEWGIMTLRGKVVELGFNKDDNLRYFCLGEKGVFEFMTDLETWNLVNNVVRPKVVEIWAILGGTGDDADVAEDANIDSDEEGEGVGGSSDGSDWEEGDSANELEEFEGSEYENDKGDDQEFAKHVDPQVEYGGVQVPTNVEAEMHVEGEMQGEQVVAEQVMAEQVVAEHVVADQVGNEEVMADLNVQSEQVMAEHIVGNAQGGQREAVAEEIPVNTQPCEELTDDELLRLFDCPILRIPNIGVHSVRVDPLLNVGDNIIANSLTNAQNMAVDTSQMEIIPSSQLQFEEMDNTSHQQQEQKSTKRKHKSKETKSLGLTKSRTTVARTYTTRSSNIMKFKNDKSSAIELD